MPASCGNFTICRGSWARGQPVYCNAEFGAANRRRWWAREAAANACGHLPEMVTTMRLGVPGVGRLGHGLEYRGQLFAGGAVVLARRRLGVLQRFVDPRTHQLGAQLFDQAVVDAHAGQPLVPVDLYFAV